MISLLGLLSVVAGTIAAYLAERFPTYLAERFPAQVEAVQTGAGVLLIGGFALAGAGLPVVL